MCPSTDTVIGAQTDVEVIAVVVAAVAGVVFC